ncbi:helix-turn-helix transcriptional regulator [Streptomyces sp. NPDC048172]|uniref:helix-turn-helix domain-containing protein n=1 Tax=Streptomyces sp. NPDC048172 TaxID=3365505 RepID=UPI0037172193
MASKRNPALKSVYRRQLSARLKELREDAELTMADVAQALEINQGSLSRIESGDRGTTPVLVKAMLDCYGVEDASERDDILDLVRADQAQRQQWWRKYSAVINTSQYGGYLSLESSATSLRNYEPGLIPGLLQSEEYARRVITAMRFDLKPKEIEALVKVRMSRKRLLEGEGAAKLWAVLDEAALRRLEGTPGFLKEELNHLLSVERQTNIQVQLLPLSAGLHPGLYGSFVLMDFPDPNPEVVWVENGPNSVYFDGPEEVARCTEIFDHLRACALGPPETRSYFRKMIKEL